MLFSTLVFSLLLINCLSRDEFPYINLPEEHIPQYFFNFPQLRKECENSLNCPYKKFINVTSCWGYEYGCTDQNIFAKPSCPGDHRGWVKDKKTQIETFSYQGDFGNQHINI